MKESARRSFEPVHEGRTEQTSCQAAACPLAAETWAAFHLLPQCSLERWTHALTRLPRDLSRQHSGWSFLFSPVLQDICTSNPWAFPGMLKRPPKVGLSSYSSAPIPAAAFFFFLISKYKINWEIGSWYFTGTPNTSFQRYIICSRSSKLQSSFIFLDGCLIYSLF